MSIIPMTITARMAEAMTDADFERLVVSPGERMCAEILRLNRKWREENDAFLAERYPGMTMDDARARWVTPEEQDAVQEEYRTWKAARTALVTA